MKKLNNKGFLLVETIVVATFTLTVLIALFLQFKNLLVSYNGSYNYNTVEGIYNLNAVKDYVMQYQSSENPLNKQLKSSNVPFLVLYKDGSCNTELEMAGLNYCDELMRQGNFKTVIFSSSDPTKLKDYLKSTENGNISEEMKNLIKRLEKVSDQNRLVAEYNNGTLATIVYGVDNINTTTTEPTPTPDPEPTPSTDTVYSKKVLTDVQWDNEDWKKDNFIGVGDSIEKITENTKDYNTLGSDYFLKHNIENGKVTFSEVCFVKDGLHCFTGGDGITSFEKNKKVLLDAFGESECTVADTYAMYKSSSLNIKIASNGEVNVGDGPNSCVINKTNSAYCHTN